MNQKPTVHRWTSKSKYFDVANGEEISKQQKEKNYVTLRITKRIKIESYEGRIEYTHECERKRQLSLW